MKKLFTLIAALLMLSASAETLSLYNYSSETYFTPINSMWYDTPGNQTQVLYPAADLTAMVGKEITAITFYTDGDGNKMDGGLLELYMGEISEAEMTDYVEGLTLVGTVSMTKQEGDSVALTLTFTTPYVYQGGNLVFGNVVKEAGNMTMTYFGGEEPSYNNCVLYAAGGKQLKKFLPKTTFTYEGGGEEPGITTLSQANALEDDAEFTFGGDAVVTVYKKGKNDVVYMFLRDESGYGLIAGVEGEFENGQVLSQGWTATKTSETNGWVRYINAAGLSASGETNDELAAPQKLTTFPDESMLNAYVVIENTSVASGSGGMPGVPKRYYELPNGEKIQKSDVLWANSADASTSNFNVYGVIVKVNGTLMINPVTTEPYVEPEGLRGDVDNSGTVDITDATMLINYLLSNDPTGINMENANCDLSEDGKVDITDATTLINYLLNNAW